jgi:hypothetical protein
VPKIHSGEKIASLTNGNWKTGYENQFKMDECLKNIQYLNLCNYKRKTCGKDLKK